MTLSALHRELQKNKVVSSSRQYLSKLVGEGKIPYSEIKDKKHFDYDDVVKALGGIELRVGSPANAKKTLHDLPLKKEGQSAKEYKEELVMELGAEPTLADSKIFLTIYQGKIAQQKFDIEAGLLVYRDDVEQKAFTVMRVVRDQMLTLPERLGGELASSTDPKEIKEIMYKEINEVLMFLHEGEALYE